jgi:hypothetical protein
VLKSDVGDKIRAALSVKAPQQEQEAHVAHEDEAPSPEESISNSDMELSELSDLKHRDTEYTLLKAENEALRTELEEKNMVIFHSFFFSLLSLSHQRPWRSSFLSFVCISFFF